MSIVDEQGNVVASYQYDPYGNVISATGDLADINPLRYRSYYYDTESSLYYLQSRYYDPELGRFLNADSYASTGQGVLGNNMFAYCNNNPICRSDPSGDLWAEIIVAAIMCIILAGCDIIDEINCYTYVLQSETDSSVNEQLTTALDPGSLSGNKYDNFILQYSPPMVKTEFDKRIIADAEALGYECIPVDNISEYKPAEGNWLIAAAYCPDPSRADYHFWRQHSDGYWSHKPGSNDVMYVDYSDNEIIDPYSCDRGRYEQFIGYYEIGPNKGGK